MKSVVAFPLTNSRARTVAEIFVNKIVFRHRVPLELHTQFREKISNFPRVGLSFVNQGNKDYCLAFAV